MSMSVALNQPARYVGLTNTRRMAIFSILLLTISLSSSGHGANGASGDTSTVLRTPSDWIHWRPLPPLPDELGVAGAYIGVSNGALIVAGGSNFPVPPWRGGEQTYRDAIFVLEPNASAWRVAGRLPTPVAHGAAVSIDNHLICLGGRDVGQSLDHVLELTWNSRTGRVDVRPLSPLPKPCYDLTASVLGGAIYVAAGRDDAGPLNRLWRLSPSGQNEAVLDKPTWGNLPPYPGPARYGASMVAQGMGDRVCLYLIGGRSESTYLTRVDRFDPERKDWQFGGIRTAELPRPAYQAAAVAWGQSHIFVFGGSSGRDVDQRGEGRERNKFPRSVFAYHTVTDTWAHIGDLPQGLAATTAVVFNKGLVIPGGEISPGVRTPQCFFGEIQANQRHLRPPDYFAVACYLAVLAGIGLWSSRKVRNSSDFLLGGQRIVWWAAGLSLLATQVSAIGLMAIPAKSFATDWAYIAGVATWFVVVPIVTSLFIPFYRRLNVTSAYEYLEARFSPTLRILGSLSYCAMQLGRMAVVLYLPALAFASVTSIEVIPAVLIMGSVSTLYTFAGGMRAVIWTDVVQAGVLVGGILLCLVAVLWQLDGGLAEFFKVAREHQKFQIVSPGWDASHATLWVVLIGNVFIRLSNLTSDQSVVQRYLTTCDERQASKALWTDVAVSIPWAILVFSLGTALFVFYRANPHLLSPTVDIDGVVPYFVAQQLPTGITGIVLAAIMAASLDGSMHSIATLMVTDIYVRMRPASTDASRFRAARFLTIVLGGLGTGGAVVLASANVLSLWDFFQYLMGLVVGGLAGLFMLGVFTTRANSRGALIGAIASAGTLAYVTQYTRVHFLLYSAIGVFSCVSVGYLASFVVSGRRQTAGLTAFTMDAAD